MGGGRHARAEEQVVDAVVRDARHDGSVHAVGAAVALLSGHKGGEGTFERVDPGGWWWREW